MPFRPVSHKTASAKETSDVESSERQDREIVHETMGAVAYHTAFNNSQTGG